MLIVLFPFVGFLYYLLNDRNNKYLPFYCIFGLTYAIILYYNNALTRGTDITRYFIWQDTYKDMSWVEILSLKDFFYPAISKIIKNISGNFYFSLGVLAILYSTLNWLCIKPIIDASDGMPNRRWMSIIFISLLLVYSFTNFNAIRYSFATLYYLWCVLEIFVNHDKRFFGFILITPIFHFSYFIFLPLPFLFLLLRERLWIVQVLFVLSAIWSIGGPSLSFNAYLMDISSDYVAQAAVDAASSYALSTSMAERYAYNMATGNINYRITQYLIDTRNYVVSFSVFIISIRSKNILKANPLLQSATALILLSFVLANIANSISCGDRFYHQACNLAVFIISFLLIKNSQDDDCNSFFRKNKLLISLVFLLTSIFGIMRIIMSGSNYAWIKLFL